ncbi:hypothetical protein B0H15DRAFT_958209 [Mycena belliarum]|uniref:Uncharacterized protein n=1 Tax=Mycena belliarum TaxID=1033014 RepID=A0AAD6TLB4_9AGAR|nr:hypothetical protein B0H15DRAFT_958209 [Mycena belliae]
MSPPPWATPEQLTWLHGWMADYITRQAQNKLHLFWPGMIEAWFRKFPEHQLLGLPMPNDADARALTDEEMSSLGAAIQKLENWFRYQRKKTRNASGAPSGVTTNRRLFNIQPAKRRRAHQPIEVFQKRNKSKIQAALIDAGYDLLNEEKMAEDVEDWENEASETAAARIKSTKSKRMRLRTHVVAALFADISPDELDDIHAEIAREKAEIKAEEEAMENLDESVPRSRTPWELQDGVDQLDSVYKETHHAAHDTAGWVGMTILGGPNPRLGGRLTVKIICSGQTPAGNDFEDVCVDFDQNVFQPFEAFLRTVFTAEMCQSRAIPNRPEPDPEERLTRDTPAEETLSSTKIKKPKRMTKPKKKKNTDAPALSTSDDNIESTADDNVEATWGSDDVTELSAASRPASSLSHWSDFGDETDVGGNNDLRMEGDDPCASPALNGIAASPPVEASPSASLFQDFENSPLDEFAPPAAEELGGPPAEDFTSSPRNQGFNPWPAGMTAPTSPTTAAAQAARERGVIDPILLQQSSTAAPDAALAHPQPAPAARAGVPATTSIGGFNFPSLAPRAIPKRTSRLREAVESHRRIPAASVLVEPTKNSASVVPGTTAPAVVGPTPTRAAAVALAVLGVQVATTAVVAPIPTTRPAAAVVAPKTTPAVVVATPTAVVAPTPTTRPAAAVVAPKTPTIVVAPTTRPAAAVVAPKTTPAVVVATPTIVVAPTRPAAAVVAPKTTPAVVVATPAIVVAPTRPAAAVVAPKTTPAAPAAVVAPTPATPAPVVVPQSRPHIKVAPAPGPKKTGTTQRPRKVATAQQAKNGVGAKQRGRPKKVPEEEEGVERQAAGPSRALASMTTAESVAPAAQGGGRGRGGWSAAAERARFEELNRDPNYVAPPDNGVRFLPNPNGNRATVLLTRQRKPAKLPDGSEVQRLVKGTRAPTNPHAATEAALLARSAAAKAEARSAGKRKAPAQEITAAPKAKKRKQT